MILPYLYRAAIVDDEQATLVATFDILVYMCVTLMYVDSTIVDCRCEIIRMYRLSALCTDPVKVTPMVVLGSFYCFGP